MLGTGALIGGGGTTATGTDPNWQRVGGVLVPVTAGDEISVPGAGADSERFGADAEADGDRATAAGANALANADDTTAIGESCEVTGAGSTAIGQGHTISGTGSTTIGQANTIAHDNCAAIGVNLTTTDDNQVLVGVAGENNQLVVETATSGEAIIRASNGFGTDQDGSLLSLTGGAGTGTGTGGLVRLQVSEPTTSGTDSQAIADRVIIDDDAVRFTDNARLRKDGRTLTQLTADADDYDPGTGTMLRISADAARTITGLVAAVDGQEVTFLVTGSYPVTFAHQDAASSAANRIITAAGADVEVEPDMAFTAWYDAVDDRWRQVSPLL